MREYVEKSIEKGIKKLGFSDHAPQFFENGYESWIRMRPSEAYDYMKEVRALGEEYKNEISVYLGFEAEYFPSIFPQLRDFCRENGVDYLILGQHSLTNEPTERWSAHASDNDEQLTRYVDEVLEGLGTGSFSYLCHPDVFWYTGENRAHYIEENARLCRGAKALGIPLEINLHGLRDKRHYPCDEFFGIAAREGNEFILGIDAHEPNEITNEETFRGAYDLAQRNGITLLDDIVLRKI